MKLLRYNLMLILLGGLSSTVAPLRTNATENGQIAPLVEVDKKIDAAMLATDAAALAPLLSERFVHIHVGDVRRDDKSSELRSLPSQKNFYLEYTKRAVDAEVVGPAGWVSAIIDAKQNTDRFPGVAPSVRYHQYRLYLVENGQWTLTYQHTMWALDSQKEVADVSHYIYSKGYLDRSHTPICGCPEQGADR